jgi:uncharacterized protein (TIGR00730 family)
VAHSIGTVAVFCGSNFGQGDVYRDGMDALGRALARAGMRVVYGGTHKGLMGALADAVLKAGGEVHGVITERLVDKGHLHPGLSSHEVTTSMAERKSRMGALADGFIATPGGIGTLDEFCAMWSLAQLEENGKPCALHNVAGFFDPFLQFVSHMVHAEFLKAGHRDMLVVEPDSTRLIARLREYRAPTVQKWF